MTLVLRGDNVQHAHHPAAISSGRCPIAFNLACGCGISHQSLSLTLPPPSPCLFLVLFIPPLSITASINRLSKWDKGLPWRYPSLHISLHSSLLPPCLQHPHCDAAAPHGHMPDCPLDMTTATTWQIARRRGMQPSGRTDRMRSRLRRASICSGRGARSPSTSSIQLW